MTKPPKSLASEVRAIARERKERETALANFEAFSAALDALEKEAHLRRPLSHFLTDFGAERIALVYALALRLPGTPAGRKTLDRCLETYREALAR